MFPVKSRPSVLYVILLLVSACMAALPARADYVATPQEERDWTARIAKAPPSNEVLGGAPFPGAKLDTRRSGEKTAENRGKPMVYIYIVRAPIDNVRTYYNGPGKRAAGAPIIVDTHLGVEIMYYMHPQKASAPATREASTPVQQPAQQQPAPAAQPPAPQAAQAPQQPAAAPTPSAPAAPDTAKQTLDAVNTLRGLFGR